MNKARILAVLGAVAMVVFIVRAALIGDFATEGAAIAGTPWGQLALVDVYVGFLLFAGWIVYREESPIAIIVWVALLMVLGNIVSCIYVLVAAGQAKGHWPTFWSGRQET